MRSLEPNLVMKKIIVPVIIRFSDGAMMLLIVAGQLLGTPSLQWAQPVGEDWGKPVLEVGVKVPERQAKLPIYKTSSRHPPAQSLPVHLCPPGNVWSASALPCTVTRRVAFLTSSPPVRLHRQLSPP